MQAFLRTQEVTAVTGVHLVRLPPESPDNPRGPRALMGGVARRVGRVTRLPPAQVPMDDCRPLTTQNGHPPPPHHLRQHHTALPTAHH